MTEQDFLLLKTLDQTQNVTQTAKILHLTHPAITRQIQMLEKELETTLLIRSRHGIRFTPEGDIALKASLAADKIMVQLRQDLNSAKGYLCGTLHAGISMNYARHYLPAILQNFRQNYPKITAQINVRHSWVLYNGLLNGDYDLAILPGEYPWNEYKKVLLKEQVFAVMSSCYENYSLEEIPFIRRQTDSFFERNANRWLEENKISPNENFIPINNTEACLEMVRHNLGWAIVPQCCLENFTGITKPLFFANTKPFLRTTYLFYPQKSAELPQVQAFINELDSHELSKNSLT